MARTQPERSASGPTDPTGGPGAADPERWLPLFRHLIDEAEDLHTVVDREGRFEFINRAAETVFGQPVAECIGRLAFDWIHPDDRERTQKAFDAWVASGSDQSISFENRQVSRDGTVREMVWTITPRVDATGQTVGFASSARDVTASRAIERALLTSETVHRALLDGLLDPAVAIDGQGIIQHVSRSVETVLGYRSAELVGRNVSLLMPEPHRSQHDSYLEEYRRTGVTNILGTTRDFQAVHKDGTMIDIELSVARVDMEAAEEPLFIGCLRDVTERNRARKVESSMLRALAALGESSALLAHEIKNPVTAVNLALRAVAKSLGEDEREVLEDLVRRMKRLEQQMRQTLSFAKPILLRIRRCEAGQLFGDVVNSQKPILDGAGVTAEIDVGPDAPAFDGDLPRLEEVVTNLVVNAVEMLGSGGRVRLTARGLGDSQVLLQVEDDGPGISGAVRDSLFKPFVTTKDQGTGLGLPICRRIVEEHGGTLDFADDGEMGGACFRIILPVDAPKEHT